MLIPALALCLLPTPQPQVDLRGQVSERYHEVCEARDADQMRELWAKHPSLILPVFDGDLESSLTLWETNKESPDLEGIAKLHERALWAAGLATEVTGRPIFADYASSFVGWDPAERLRFREGQKAVFEARRAMREGNAAEALRLANHCRELAVPLGDWWGAGMGFASEGQAYVLLGQHENAVTAFSQARLLYSQLGLESSELGVLVGMLDSLEALGRWRRAHTACKAANMLALVSNPDLALELEERMGKIEAKLSAK